MFTGVFDILDGKVIESLTFEEAEKNKFKHTMFSDKSNIGYKECKYGRFIVDGEQMIIQDRGVIRSNTREAELIKIIREQINGD